MRASRSRFLAPALAVAVITAASLPAAARADGATGHGRSRISAAAGDWSMWGYDRQRTGFDPNETTLSPSTVPGLNRQWAFPLAARSDNAPVFASGVDVDGTPTDIVYAGDRSGIFYAVDAATGTKVWSRDLGTISSTCFGTLGVASTALIDRPNNVIYAIGGSGALYALNLATGATQPGWPVQITQFPNEYVWDAIAENAGELYLGVASTCDRGGTYYGRVTRVNASSAQVDANFYVTDGPTTGVSGGGVWGWGGVSIDPSTGDVFEASGNGFPTHRYEHYRYAESVVRLHPDLTLVASNYPGLDGSDVDFGSTPIVFTARPACGEQLFVLNKDGEALLYDAGDIASGPVDDARISTKEVVGVATYSPADQRIYVATPSNSPDNVYKRGLIGFSIRRDCKLRLAWNRNVKAGGVSSSPITANGVLYWGDGGGHRLLAFDLAAHRLIWTSPTFDAELVTEPIVVGGHLYITVGSNLYAFGL